MTTGSESPDPDSVRVLEVLTAARRGLRDPDLELAAVLAESAAPASETRAQEILRALADDAGTHRR